MTNENEKEVAWVVIRGIVGKWVLTIEENAFWKMSKTRGAKKRFDSIMKLAEQNLGYDLVYYPAGVILCTQSLLRT